MAKVKLIFRVQKITEHFSQRDISLHATECEQNKELFIHGPAAKLSMLVSNPEQLQFFQEGLEYIITIKAKP